MEKETDNTPQNTSEFRIRETWNELREMKEATLDKTWFYKVLEETPHIAEEYEAVQEKFNPHVSEFWQYKDSAMELKSLIHSIRTIILPNLRERLGISFLKDRRPSKNSDHYIHNSLIASVFPQNLEKLNEIVDNLITQIDYRERKKSQEL